MWRRRHLFATVLIMECDISDGCDTSDSCDSEPRDPDAIKFSSMGLECAAAEELVADCATSLKRPCKTLSLRGNRLRRAPVSIALFTSLHTLDLSNNQLVELPDAISSCPLVVLYAKNNRLDDASMPKSFPATLEELNLSGNRLANFPKRILELNRLRYLYLAANAITSVPRDVRNITGLRVLSLGGNAITEVPDSVGELKKLRMLVLCENKIERLPASIGCLNRLRTLLLHKNRLKTLPIEIVTLECLTELSLRDNPLVVRFAADVSLRPPALLELAARTVKLYDVPVHPEDVPDSVFEYLESARRCVNPQCKGVFFDSRVEHVKFVDFCGKYRLPLLQYLCGSRCVENVREGAELDPVARGYMMKKVLLG